MCLNSRYTHQWISQRPMMIEQYFILLRTSPCVCESVSAIRIYTLTGKSCTNFVVSCECWLVSHKEFYCILCFDFIKQCFEPVAVAIVIQGQEKNTFVSDLGWGYKFVNYQFNSYLHTLILQPHKLEIPPPLRIAFQTYFWAYSAYIFMLVEGGWKYSVFDIKDPDHNTNILQHEG